MTSVPLAPSAAAARTPSRSEPPPPFASIVTQLSPVGGLTAPPSLSGRLPGSGGGGGGVHDRAHVTYGGRGPSRIEQFDAIITKEEAEEAAAALAAEEAPLTTGLNEFLEGADAAVTAVAEALEEAGEALEDAVEAALGGEETAEEQAAAYYQQQRNRQFRVID